jgi:hypothetical protein
VIAAVAAGVAAGALLALLILHERLVAVAVDRACRRAVCSQCARELELVEQLDAAPYCVACNGPCRMQAPSGVCAAQIAPGVKA